MLLLHVRKVRRHVVQHLGQDAPDLSDILAGIALFAPFTVLDPVHGLQQGNQLVPVGSSEAVRIELLSHAPDGVQCLALQKRASTSVGENFDRILKIFDVRRHLLGLLLELLLLLRAQLILLGDGGFRRLLPGRVLGDVALELLDHRARLLDRGLQLRQLLVVPGDGAVELEHRRLAIAHKFVKGLFLILDLLLDLHGHAAQHVQDAANGAHLIRIPVCLAWACQEECTQDEGAEKNGLAAWPPRHRHRRVLAAASIPSVH
mmetsp:Transcript_13116/g.35908  ORF Transcript_13116/g.35908 Transcript_13116/m.35908 type:complete len:261 (-) Transcript_13116:61-843(-)